MGRINIGPCTCVLIDEKPFRSVVANKSLKPNPGNEHERNRTSATQCSLQQSQMTGTSSGFSSACIDTVYGLIHTLKCGVFWLNSSFVITSELQRQWLKKARQCCERTGAASGAFCFVFNTTEASSTFYQRCFQKAEKPFSTFLLHPHL